VRDFERQIAKVEATLSGHDGPVILAGDFNTWRVRRIELLQALAQRLGLDELSFEVDDRITPFGKIVDRIFVRGLNAVDAKTSVVHSSDHNPLSVTLRMNP
jgi:endonuclease/exonuclease/phosphatase (EEP) superfamily protein YafD